MPPLRILHVHSTFAAGGKELRAARLMNAFGESAVHSIVSGVPGALAARTAIDKAVAVQFPADGPPLTGKPSPARFEAIARFMRGYDLVLSYNWGAMDAVMARRMYARDCPPLVHHEDGFNEDEAHGLKRERGWYRRLALPGAYRLIVPSERLERIALGNWKQPRARVERIANGVPVSRFAKAPRPNAIPGFKPRKGELVIGTVAGLRKVKHLTRLVAEFVPLAHAARLVIVGEGPDRAAIAAAAAEFGIADRVHLAGFVADPAKFVGLFDIFALSSDSEQAPISVLEAMAAGLPVVAPAVGDIAAMVSAENRPFIADPSAQLGLLAAMTRLADDERLRANVGAANRAKAIAEFDEAKMIARYARLYGEAAGRPDALVTGLL